MRTAKALAAAGLAAMAGVLAYGFSQGDFRKEGAQLLRMPWGIVSLLDVYVGFSFFSAWIVFREKSLARAVPWVLGVLIGGNVVSAAYALLALVKSDGDWHRFWLGARAGE